MASNNSLQKLLVNVPSASCDAFIKQYIDPTWAAQAGDAANTVVLPEVAADHNTAYDNKVVFLEKYHAIFTQGALFGYDKDFHSILADLIDGGITSEVTSANGISVTTKLTYDKDKRLLKVNNNVAVTAAEYSNKTWSNPNNVVTGATVKTYVDEQVAGAVAEATAAMNFRGPITETSFDTIKAAASNGDVYVVEGNFTINNTEKFEEGDLVIFAKDDSNVVTYTVVERNLDDAIVTGTTFNDGQLVVAEGTGKVKTTGYVTGSDATTYTAFGTANTLATEVATAAYVVGKIQELDTTYTSGTYNYVSYTYTQVDGIVTNVGVSLTVADYEYAPAGEGTSATFTYESAGLIDHVILNNYISYVGDQITDIQNYIDSINETFTTVSTESDYVSISYSNVNHEGIENGDLNDYAYTINVVTKTLGDAVGMYVGEDGKWHAADGTVTADGLATAADVAKEIVENEKVIAAALNDHEARLDALENDIDNLGDTITSSFEALDGTATASDANSYVSVTINEVDGKLTNEGSSLTVQYGTVDADLQVTTNGLIDAAQLAHVLNNINLWETFSPEA